jgi:hypothetical protein
VKIMLDSNALHGDPVMVREPARRVFQLLGPARATLVFSPVVLAELERQRAEDIADLKETIISRLKKLDRLAGSSAAQDLTDITLTAVAASTRWRERWDEILADPHVVLAKWPVIDAKSMAERELSRRRPFMDKEAGTIGHRDTLIWLAVVELARAEPNEDIVLVTADKGFLGREGLHPDLLADLSEDDLQEHVAVLGSLSELVNLLIESDTGEWSDWRAAAIANVLATELATLQANDFTPYFDAREGDTEAPTFDLGLPSTGHDWTLDYIDGPSDLQIETTGYGASSTQCSFVVELSLSGFMDKWDWYGGEHPNVELWDANWNEHLVAIEANLRVTFKALARVDDDHREAEFVEFLDVSAE